MEIKMTYKWSEFAKNWISLLVAKILNVKFLKNLSSMSNNYLFLKKKIPNNIRHNWIKNTRKRHYRENKKIS